MADSPSKELNTNWEHPDAVARTLAKLDATPEDLALPERISRHMKVCIDADGEEREVQFRELVRGGPSRTQRMLVIGRCSLLPHPPTVKVEGARLERFRVDLPTLTCAFELILDRPLTTGELAMVQTTIRYPGQRDNFAEWRVRPSVRDFGIQVEFDPSRLPSQCVYYYRPSTVEPKRILVSAGSTDTMQFATLDPTPGIYGVQWDWPEA